MINGKRVLIIIPAWNESGSIADVVAEVRGELPGVSVIVVDDGSTDDTSLRAAAAGAIVARLPYNLGVGGAMRTGYRYARDHGFDVAIQVDADGQHDPRYIPKLVDALDDHDLASAPGSPARAIRGQGPPEVGDEAAVAGDLPAGPHPAHRHHVGHRAVQPPADRAVRQLVSGRVSRRHHRSLVRTARMKYKITQIPVAMRPRMAGTPSNSPVKASIYLARAGMGRLFASTPAPLLKEFLP